MLTEEEEEFYSVCLIGILVSSILCLLHAKSTMVGWLSLLVLLRFDLLVHASLTYARPCCLRDRAAPFLDYPSGEGRQGPLTVIPQMVKQHV